MSSFKFDRALVRAPGRSVTAGLSSQSGPRPTFAAVVHEHQQYIQALQQCGLQVDVLPALEEFPDSIFVEDPALVLNGAAILLRPGAATRRGETAHLSTALHERFATVLRMESGFADGGDVLSTAAGAMIGLSSRTNREGATELAGLLRSAGIESRIVATPAGTLHLKSDCALIASDQVLCTPSLAAADIFVGLRKLVVADGEARAANCLRLNDTILVGEEFPRTASLLRAQGLEVLTLPVAAIGRLDAGLSCMSLRWRAVEDRG